MVIRERPDIVEKYKHRYVKRKMVRPIRTAMRMIELPPDFYRHISGLAAEARRQKIPAERRSELARNAVNARWRKHREQRSQIKTRPPLKTWDGKVGLAARRAPFYGSTKS
jgi:hypothetical protein